MKIRHIALFLLISLLVVTAPAETLSWKTVQMISPGTRILVVTKQRTLCSFQTATNEQLFCRVNSTDTRHPKPDVDLTFNRSDIQQVYSGDALEAETYDYSKGFLSLILAAGGGGGLDSANQPTSFAGIKIGGMGGPISLDLQYDRIQGKSGFSTEGSEVLPVFRVPRFKRAKEPKFVKVFAEPGLGYRAGSGPFGGYSSAKVMAVLLTDTWSDNWVAPYVEVQRRFPFNSPLDGDTRLTFGLMLALCEHCGLD
jgi:hypothetical protein